MEDKLPESQTHSTPPAAESAAATTPITPSVTHVAELPAESASSTKKAVMISLAILILAVGGFGAWRLMGQKITKKETSKVIADTKKDIPLIRYAVLDNHISAYPPVFASDSNSSFIDRQMYEALIGWENSNKLVPMLAKSWTNPDNNTWIFKLQPNVKFHTGRIMEASDVKGSIEAAAKQEGYGSITSNIKTVEVVDSQTVKITTKQPDAVLLNKLSFVFIYDVESTIQNDPITGTGPYIVKPGTKTTPEKIEMVAFDGFHGGHVYTREVVIEGIPKTEDMATRLIDGTLDIVNSGSKDDFANIKAKIPAATIISYDNSSVFSLFINTIKGPLSSLKLRQALLLTIDPQKLIDVSKIPSTVANQLVVSTVAGYNPTIKRPAIDLAKAKQLVIDAGFPKGVTINLQYVSSQQVYIDEISTELAAVGITVKRSLLSSTDYVPSLQKGKTDGGLIGIGSDLNDSSDVIASIMQSGNQYYLYKNVKIDQLAAEANITFDPEKRLAILQEIVKIANDDVFQIPIRTRTGQAAIAKPYILGNDIPGIAALGIYFWKLHL